MPSLTASRSRSVPDPQTALCRCGQLTATATGQPVRISVRQCLDCQKRSGSAFASQLRFPAAQVALGAFADPYFATPTVSVWEERQHEWVEIASEMEHYE